MRIDKQILVEILKQGGVENVIQIHSIVYSSIEEFQGKLPECLVNLPRENLDQVIDQLWCKVNGILPRTIQAIKEKIIDIFLIDSETENYFLLYVFVEEGLYLGFRGNLPIEKIPQMASGLLVDLSMFYSNVHNGWYEIDSNDGLLPVESFEVFKEPETNKPNFLKIFQKGVNSVGFDLDSINKEAYVLWVEDNDVEKIIEFWTFIDKWFVVMLEDCGANSDRMEP